MFNFGRFPGLNTARINLGFISFLCRQENDAGGLKEGIMEVKSTVNARDTELPTEEEDGLSPLQAELTTQGAYGILR